MCGIAGMQGHATRQGVAQMLDQQQKRGPDGRMAFGPLLQQYAEEVVTAGLPEGWTKEEWLYWTQFRTRYGREEILAGMGRSRSLNPGQTWQSALAAK